MIRVQRKLILQPTSTSLKVNFTSPKKIFHKQIEKIIIIYLAVTHAHIVCLFLILRALVRLLITFPNIVCFPFNSGVAPRVKKN